MRRAAAGLAAAGLGAALLLLQPAAAEEPLPDPVSAAEWAARDFEGRWALMARDGQLARGVLSAPWSTFLERRGEWNLLEWAAIATDRSPAIQALVNQGDSNWMRVAVWALGNRDSHSFDSTATDLERRPALVRGWFQLHPRALSRYSRPLLARLEQAGGPVDLAGARLLDPPYVPERLLAALNPPPDVQEFGERKRAAPGVTYLHQVERALAIWARSPLDEEQAWQTRVAALLSHPVQGVRKAAALTLALRRPVPGAPLEQALLTLLRDPASAPDARSAALIALTEWAGYATRLVIVDVALDPQHPAFTAALSGMQDRDQDFLLAELRRLDLSEASPATAAFVATHLERLQAARAEQTAAERALELPQTLGLAAYADLVAWPRREALGAWTVQHLRALAAREPEARVALAALRDDASPATAPAEPERRGELELRVRALLERILPADATAR